MGKVRRDSAFEEFLNSADPVELPQAFLQFITMKGMELLSICSLDVFLKIIFLSFLLYLTTAGKDMWHGSWGQFQSRMLHLHSVRLRQLFCQEVLALSIFII